MLCLLQQKKLKNILNELELQIQNCSIIQKISSTIEKILKKRSMNSTLIDDSNDSAMFVSSLTQKRKASSYIISKNTKQAKITFFEPTYSENCSTVDKPKKSEGEDNNDLCKTELENNNSSKSETVENKCNESTSIYFDKKKRSTSSCPLCLKSFENDANHLAHLKQCAKKNKMTTQQLLSALELQKKHLKERKDLGLPSQTLLKPKKVTKKKEEEKLKGQIECDLSLGIALSKSLEKNHESKSSHKEENYPVLDEFGFTSSNSKAKKKKTSKPILKERTNEDRQRIITEKAGIVLLEENDEKNLTQLKIRDNPMNFYLFKFHNKLARLWSLTENDGKLDWYVGEIKPFLINSDEESAEEKKNEGELALDNISTEDIHEEVRKLNLPKPRVAEDWRKMINNPELSDLTCRSKDEHSFYFHSLVALVRCPYLYCGTLNSLSRTDVENLKLLAQDFDYEELVNVLNDLVTNLTSRRSISEQQTPLSETPDLFVDEIKIGDSVEEANVFSEKKDLFDEEMVDLTQSSHGSSTVDEEDNEINMDKSYWSFMQYEKKKKEEEELRKEEERENSIISTEMEKIETSMKQQKEIMEKILSEYEEKETDIQNKLELEKIYNMQRRKSSDSTTRDLDLEEGFTFKSKMNSTVEDCILLSSDSDTRNSRPEVETPPPQSVPLCSFLGEVPSFDPYENYNYLPDCNFSPVIHSQSLLAGIDSPDPKMNDSSATLKAGERAATTNSPPSTPVTLRRSPRIKRSNKKSEKIRKRRSDLSGGRILRKSLSLSCKSLKSTLNKRKSLKCRKIKTSKKDDNEWLEELTNSILCEFNKSPLLRCSTPVENNKFVELTPKQNKEVEIEESVTPYPNYSLMEESSLKKHLAKYGLKKNLGKKKAGKILKHIYQELHPFLNPETGKLVKKINTETPKISKNKKRKTSRITKKKKSLPEAKNTSPSPTAEEFRNLSVDVGQASDKSIDSIDRSTEYDSDNSGFEDFEDILTQSDPSDPIDLPSAMKKFLELNPSYHRKILLYEPIWLGELQRKLKESFKKHFKMSDVMDYLDQKCITFRSETQKKNNEKRNERKKRAKLKRMRST